MARACMRRYLLPAWATSSQPRDFTRCCGSAARRRGGDRLAMSVSWQSCARSTRVRAGAPEPFAEGHVLPAKNRVLGPLATRDLQGGGVRGRGNRQVRCRHNHRSLGPVARRPHAGSRVGGAVGVARRRRRLLWLQDLAPVPCSWGVEETRCGGRPGPRGIRRFPCACKPRDQGVGYASYASGFLAEGSRWPPPGTSTARRWYRAKKGIS